MERSSMSALTMAGAVLVLVGLLALAVPMFSMQRTQDVARIGDLKLQTTQQEWYIIPPLASGGTLVLGIVLIGAGFYQRR